MLESPRPREGERVRERGYSRDRLRGHRRLPCHKGEVSSRLALLKLKEQRALTSAVIRDCLG
jgi:hypothetical protein